MKRLFTALFFAAFPGHAAEIGPEALEALRADIVVLGEVHDNPAHHVNQARAVAAIAPRALVFEMLTPEQAALATPELRSDPEALEAAFGWEASGWPDFSLYAPIFAAAPEAAIYGAAMRRAEVRRAMSEGAASVFGEGAGAFGLNDALSPADQAALETEQMESHCNALPQEMLPGMVAAQRLRDAAFARATLRAFDETGGPVVLITGSGHARTDRGVPFVIGMARPDVSVVSVGQLERPADGAQPFDRWLTTDPAPREDPCAGLR